MVSLIEIAFSFIKLGCTAFGGPAAHIAMMEADLVQKKKWLTTEEFLDLNAATNLIPGPNSTELAIHIGYKKAGWPGLIVAGVCFILPAFLIVWAIAWFYIEYGNLPAFKAIFIAVIPVIIAVIVQAIQNLTRSAVKNISHWILAALALAGFLWGLHELIILFSIAALNLLWSLNLRDTRISIAPFAVFLYFTKVGSVLFGSGYVLIAFLQNDLVHKYQWITEQQLIDAIAVGQFTPGPVFTTATFIGYIIAGHFGAVAATLGIFLPAFIFVALSAPFISKLRSSKNISSFLDGLNIASLSLMAGAAILLIRENAFSLYFAIVFIVSFLLLTRFKINSAWVLLAAAALSFVI